MSALKMGTATLATENAGSIDIERASFPAGTVLRVFSKTITEHETLGSGNSGGTPYTIPGTDQNGNGSIFSVTITPLSASNKIMLFGDLSMALSDSFNYNFYWAFYRSIGGATATTIGIGTEGTGTNLTGGYNMYISAGAVPFLFGNMKHFMDSPNTTSEVKYHIQAGAADSNATLYINRRGNNDSIGGISTITAMEIAG